MPGVAPAPTLALSFADLTPLLFWLVALIAVTLVGGVVMLVVRRVLLAPPQSRESTFSGIMDDLRAMHARGDLTDEEFAAARKRMVENLTAKPTSDNPPDPSKNPT